MRTFFCVLALSSCLLPLACGNSSPETSDAGGGGQASSSGGGGATASGTGGQGGAEQGTGGAPGGEVPADPQALFAFLAAGGYKDFAAEPEAHPSTGPHSNDVRVFRNPILEASLLAGDTVFPKGAAAVKEIGVQNGNPTGWAVWVKIQDDSAGGDGFYWYEHFSTTNGDNPAFSGVGLGLCANCHAGGVDYYLSL